jgi:hypothetical protein
MGISCAWALPQAVANVTHATIIAVRNRIVAAIEFSIKRWTAMQTATSARGTAQVHVIPRAENPHQTAIRCGNCISGSTAFAGFAPGGRPSAGRTRLCTSAARKPLRGATV